MVTKNIKLFRFGVITVLIFIYALLAYYASLVLHMDVVYTHFAYIPIVLSGVWWGRKSIPVALFLSGIILSFHVFGIDAGSIWSDLVRSLFFLIVAVFIGAISQKVIASRRALRISEGKYKLLINKSLTGIFVYRDKYIVFANPRFASMLGYHLNEIIGKCIWDFFHEEDKPLIQELAEKRKKSDCKDLHYQARLLRKDGRLIWVDVASSLETFEGESSVLVNIYDITAKKKAEEQRLELSTLAYEQEEQLVHSSRLAELGEMAAGVAHELNQPLTGIRNFARNAFYMLEQNAGSADEVKDNLRLISEQVDRASRIINQMRELTRKSERQFIPLDINGIVGECLEFLTPQLKLSGIEVSLSLGENMPQTLGDRVRLEQVFLNVITNANQSMEGMADRRINIKTHYESGATLPIVVEVQDTGKGFSHETRAKLFTPFYSTKRAGKGTGLGLSISLSIIKEHKGAIEASGEPDKGATFVIRLPEIRGKE